MATPTQLLAVLNNLEAAKQGLTTYAGELTAPAAGPLLSAAALNVDSAIKKLRGATAKQLDADSV